MNVQEQASTGREHYAESEDSDLTSDSALIKTDQNDRRIFDFSHATELVNDPKAKLSARDLNLYERAKGINDGLSKLKRVRAGIAFPVKELDPQHYRFRALVNLMCEKDIDEFVAVITSPKENERLKKIERLEKIWPIVPGVKQGELTLSFKDE